jgi:chemotaxis protein methyltransferase CheR
MSNPKSEFRNPKLSDHDYKRFRDLILERTGMLFGPRRRDELAGGVLAAAERAGCESLGDYCLLLQEARTDSELWDDLIGAITVGETYFFRNPSHFDALRRYILPGLVARHRDDRRLRIWSAGCSSGEEPYSLAILLRQLLPDIADWNIFILATDINKQALRQARQSCYREWPFRQTDPAIREGYFTPLNRSSGKARGRQDRLFELSPQVREMVTFAYLNLAEDAYPSLATNTNAMDLILCRNVAIYLPEAVIREMAERFHRCLVTDGWLIVGASETNSMIYDQFAVRNCCGALFYQKVAVFPSPSVRPELFGEPFDAVQETPVEWPLLQPVVQPLPLLPTPPVPRPEPIGLTLDVTLQQAQDSAQDEDRVMPTEELRPEPVEGAPPQPRGKPAGPERSRRVKAPAVPADPYQEGLVLLGQGRYEKAMTCFLDCMARDPDCALAYYQMARVHANKGLLEEARSWCQQAIERDSLLTEAHYILALIHQEEGMLDEAIARLKKTLYLDSNFVLARFSLANLYQQVNRQSEAARHRAQAIRLAAKMPPDEVVPGSDDLTAGRLLTMMRATM